MDYNYTCMPADCHAGNHGLLRCGSPGFAKHKEQHDGFKKTITELDEMLQEEEGPSEAFVEKVEKNVIQWFYTHIEGFDRSVAEYKFMRENNGRL